MLVPTGRCLAAAGGAVRRAAGVFYGILLAPVVACCVAASRLIAKCCDAFWGAVAETAPKFSLLPSLTEYPRRSRGVAATCLRGIPTSRRASSQVCACLGAVGGAFCKCIEFFASGVSWICNKICGAIGACCSWVRDTIVVPIWNVFVYVGWKVYELVLVPIGNCGVALGGCVYDYLLAPIGRALVAIYDNVLVPIGSAIGAVLGAIASALGAVAEAVGSVLSAVAAAIGSLINAVSDAISSIFPR